MHSNPEEMPKPVSVLAGELGLDSSQFEPFGWSASKLAFDLHRTLSGRPVGRLIGVTAINPTPFGEGKTVVAIGLAMALCRRSRRTIATLRQPSLAPVFGIKGGGAGGGRCRLLPADDINLHFTGDLHAVAAATNLLAAMIDNHCQRRLEPLLAEQTISWRRAIDVSDKGLAHIETGLNDVPQAPRRQTGFDLTAASEVMSILALATDLSDLRERLGRIAVGQMPDGQLITAEDLGAAGAMAALMRHAVRPNLVQTSEQTPALVHAGPFANISHGNSSVIADLTALRLAEFVVTESGFGSDLGAEKLFNIKCRTAGIKPAAEVIVCTVRGLKYQSGRFVVRPGRPLPDALLQKDTESLVAGIENLRGHLANLRQYGMPVVVAVNQFPSDTDEEIQLVRQLAVEAGAHRVAATRAFAEGSDGALELADAVLEAASERGEFQQLYSLDLPLEAKIERIARQTYGAAGVEFAPGVVDQLRQFEQQGFGSLPVCMAKTQYSLSHDPKLLGRPSGFQFPVREVRLAAGAGFVLAQAEGISLMPGLPRIPAARGIDISPDGQVQGL